MRIERRHFEGRELTEEAVVLVEDLLDLVDERDRWLKRMQMFEHRFRVIEELLDGNLDNVEIDHLRGVLLEKHVPGG